MSARDEILQRIATATAPAGPAAAIAGTALDVPRRYHGADTAQPERSALLDQLVDRLEDYRAVVRRCPAAALPATLADALVARARGRDHARFVVPPGIDRGWLTALPAHGTITLVPDAEPDPLDAAALDQMDGVVTACTVAVAQTGTIVLDASPDQGRRIITLVPDHHLVVVRADQVVATVPHAVARMHPTRPLTMISGPSATSDIELNRVEGVHGPRTLEVILVD